MSYWKIYQIYLFCVEQKIHLQFYALFMLIGNEKINQKTAVYIHVLRSVKKILIITSLCEVYSHQQPAGTFCIGWGIFDRFEWQFQEGIMGSIFMPSQRCN